MSSRSYLIANDIPGGAVGEIGRNSRCDGLLAEVPCSVPVYWLALFDEADLVRIEAEDEEGTSRALPSLVTGLEAAKERFRARRPLLAARFPEFDPDWERFDARLAAIEARFIKVDFSELHALMDGDDAEADQVQSAVRWFDSRDEDDFEQLLEAASITGYDLARRTFPGDDQVPRTFHLQGCPKLEREP